MTLEVTLGPVTDWEALGACWRELEDRADASFFQSWSWIGCLAAERYDDPVVLEARRDGRRVALGLFNRQRSWPFHTLWLQETGDPATDSVFIEHNGLLIETSSGDGGGPAADDALRLACLVAARRAGLPGSRLPRRLHLGGVDARHLRAAGMAGVLFRLEERVAPALDLAALRRAGQTHEDVLSGNTRAQLRRSLRAYAAIGAVTLRRAADGAEAHRFLDELGRLHQATWEGRGRPGAFAEPRFARFHHALIDRALPRGEVALWRINVDAATIGYLYNFTYRGRVLAYQSGFDYALADRRAKPGLTCHHLAIERALAEDHVCYDFMAGDDRYKRSFSNTNSSLYWMMVGSGLDPARLLDGVRGLGRAIAPARVKNWLSGG